MENSSSSPTHKKSGKTSGLASLQGTCPICGETIITIDKDKVTFSHSHITSTHDSDGNVIIQLQHAGTPSIPTTEPAINPGPIYYPPKRKVWIVVESMDIRPL